MFLGHNATFWGIVIGIAAIILTIPLTIIGNFITPTVAFWGLRWTDKSLTKRIASREAELKAIEGLPLISETEDQLLSAALCIAYLLSFTMNMLGIAAVLIAFEAPTPPVRLAPRIIFGVIGFGFYLLPWMWRRSTINELKKYRHDRSPKWRTALHEVVESYKAILAKSPTINLEK